MVARVGLSLADPTHRWLCLAQSGWSAFVWHCLYSLPWTQLDVAVLTTAAQAVAQHLNAQLQIEPTGRHKALLYFTVPTATLRQREASSFQDDLDDHQLGHATSLTLSAMVHLVDASASTYQLRVTSEDGSNDLCDRTAVFIANALANQLNASPMGQRSS